MSKLSTAPFRQRPFLVLVVCLALTTLESSFAQSGVPNDNFTNSTHLEGTNIYVIGNGASATVEIGEPMLDPTNSTKTVWYSWVAPFNSRVTFTTFRPGAIYTGSTIEGLQRVSVPSYPGNVFFGQEGSVYHFQIDTTEYADDFSLSISAQQLAVAVNDNFSNACVVKGYNPTAAMPAGSGSIMGATIEPGEPQHRGDLPSKSIWWKWQAPVSGLLNIYVVGGLAPDPVLAVYTGTSLANLTLHAKGDYQLVFGVAGGVTYYFAAAVPADAIGDVGLQGNSVSGSSSSRQIPGNLLVDGSFELLVQNPSSPPGWDGTNVGGAFVGERGGADGSSWLWLAGQSDAKLWQDVPTVPGRSYEVRFAFVGENSPVFVQTRVKWGDQEIGVAEIPSDEVTFWHWTNFTAVATADTTRLMFENLGSGAGFDGVSVVWLNEPASIVAQPRSISAYTGGQAVFMVGARGSEPLTYQWYFMDQAVANGTNQTLTLDPVSAGQAGEYHVVVSNAFGQASSQPASLVVNDAQEPTIVLQPYGDTVVGGGYFAFSVSAIGTTPLTYQWLFNGTQIENATNRQLILNPVLESQAGGYSVAVSNYRGSTFSLPAVLRVDDNVSGGGTVWLANQSMNWASALDAPVFDTDGVSKLNGGGFVAQLYAGPSTESLRAAGSPMPFQSGFRSGIISPLAVTIPSVPPAVRAFTQIRAWEVAKGASYEEARVLGGKFGRSAVVEVTLGSIPNIPPYLIGLKSFSLQAGLPQFTAGRIELAERKPDGTVIWSLIGEPGYRYLIEKNSDNSAWKPMLVITNSAGNVTFVDPNPTNSNASFYRSRILD